LFPIDWPEPFGLVMIEAMSAGTPVIAWPNGSVPEVIADGVSGRIVGSIDAAAGAARQIAHMDRRKVRAEFERRFTAERMADAHIAAYRLLLARASAPTRLMVLPMAPPAAPELLPRLGNKWRRKAARRP
jgi:glycosyltransferase involved in cell wall biosynthesis